MDRSENMRRIRSTDTLPELALRRALHGRGLRYRLHCKDLPGTPDIVFRAARAAIFVNGCFWHRHENCRFATRPKTRVEYWEPKLRRNAERDLENQQALLRAGYRVFVVWECQLATEKEVEAVAAKIERRLAGVKTRLGRYSDEP